MNILVLLLIIHIVLLSSSPVQTRTFKNASFKNDVIVTFNPRVSVLDKYNRYRYNENQLMEMLKLASTEFSRLHIQLDEDDLINTLETSSIILLSQVVIYNSKHKSTTNPVPIEVWISLLENSQLENFASPEQLVSALANVAGKVNSKFDKTVTTLLFPSTILLSLKHLANFNVTSFPQWGIITYDDKFNGNCLSKKLRNLKPDFILVPVSNRNDYVPKGTLFESLDETFTITCKNEPQEKVGILTSCPDTDRHGKVNMTRAISCWKMVRSWAKSRKKPVIMNQAFDTPYYREYRSANISGWWRYIESDPIKKPGVLGTFQLKSNICQDFDAEENRVDIRSLEKPTTFKSPYVGVIFSLYDTDTLLVPNQDPDKQQINLVVDKLYENFNKTLILLDNYSQKKVECALLELRSLERLKGKIDIAALLLPFVPLDKFFEGSIRKAENQHNVANNLISTFVFPYYDDYEYNQTWHTFDSVTVRNTILEGRDPSTYKIGYAFPISVCSKHWKHKSDKDSLDAAISNSEVVYFYFEEFEGTVNLGVRRMFEQRIVQFKNCQRFIQRKLHKAITFVMISYRDPNAKTFYENYLQIYNFVKYWEMLRDWAMEEKTTVILSNLIDTNRYFYAEIEDDEEMRHTLYEYYEFGWWRRKTSDYRNGGSSQMVWTDKKTEALQRAPKRAQNSNPPIVKSGLNTLQIVFVALFPLIICCGLSGVLLWLMRRHYKHSYLLSYTEMQEFFEGNSNLGRDEVGEHSAHSLPYDKDRYEIYPTDFSIDDNMILGKGEFGMVLRGKILKPEQNISVAVKTTNSVKFRKTALNDLLTEIKVLAYVDGHPNVIKLLGAYTSDLKRGKVYVFLELCHLGSLENNLRTLRPPPVGIEDEPTQRSSEYVNLRDVSKPFLDPSVLADLHRWSAEIASGMNFLVSKQVVHADLATRNVLLNIRREVKISDFGLARRIYNYTNYVKQKQEPMPWRWMPPESLRLLQFNEKSDVWAYGVTLWEMYNLGEQPYPGMSYDVNFPTLLEKGLRPIEPKYGDEDMYNLMKDCWKINPDRRPTFADLVARFSDDYDDLFEEN